MSTGARVQHPPQNRMAQPSRSLHRSSRSYSKKAESKADEYERVRMSGVCAKPRLMLVV